MIDTDPRMNTRGQVCAQAPRSTAIAWCIMTLLAVAIGFYGILMLDGRSAKGTVFGQVWVDRVHFIGGGIALVVGALAFHRGILRRNPKLHRLCGYLYLACVASSGIASLAMATQSALGMTTHLGFGFLAIVWLGSSAHGFRAIKHGHLLVHRRWMVYSYAACYAAVMLRLQMWPLAQVLGSFPLAYQVVSWSCWVPNLLFAEYWLRRTDAAGRWRRT